MADRRRFVVVAACVLIGFTGIGALASQVPADPVRVPRTSMLEFVALHAAGTVLVVDVRPAEAYRDGHVPGAMNVPWPDVEARAPEILERSGGRPIVTYCACSTEQTSAHAAAMLSARGAKKVTALAGGFNAWIDRGGRIEK